MFLELSNNSYFAEEAFYKSKSPKLYDIIKNDQLDYSFLINRFVNAHTNNELV